MELPLDYQRTWWSTGW